MFYILPCLLCNFCVRLFFPYYFYEGYPRLLQKSFCHLTFSFFTCTYCVGDFFETVCLNCFKLLYVSYFV